MFACIVAVEELAIEQLDPDHSKDELEKGVDNEDVEDILEGNDVAVEYSLQLGNSRNEIYYFISVGSFCFCHLLIVFKGRRTRNNLIAFNL